MKKITVILLLTFLTNTIYSQELPEITTKNGIAYYVFQHKLDNTKKCLSKYFEPKGPNTIPIEYKLVQQCTQYTTNQDKLGKQGISSYKLTGILWSCYYNTDNPHQYNVFNCSDTIAGESSRPSLDVTMNQIYWKPSFIDLRKKIMSQKLTAKIDVIFLSKNEYKLVVKDIVYSVTWSKGSTASNDLYNIGEYYEQVKNSDSIEKDAVNFFLFIDKLIKSADEIILKTLTDTYLADEI